MGHWYLIVSIDFHEYAMISMMVLSQGYALDFVSFDVRKPLPRDELPEMGVPSKLGWCVNAWNGVKEFLEGMCRREGKSGDGFVLAIKIYRWNQMHIGSV